MAKKLILDLILASFSPNLVLKIFFHGFYLQQILCIVASYQCIQFQGKLMNQTLKNSKKHFEKNVSVTILASLAKIWVTKTFFVDFTSTRCETLTQISLYAISTKTNEPNLRKWMKTQFQARFWPASDQIWSPKTFLWGLTLPDVIHCCKLSLHAISRKTL